MVEAQSSLFLEIRVFFNEFCVYKQYKLNLKSNLMTFMLLQNYPVTIGLCVPKDCTNSDVLAVLTFLGNITQEGKYLLLFFVEIELLVT